MTANEFATMLCWWHGHPFDGSHPERPNKIHELLSAMESGPAKPRDDMKGCFVAGVVTALEKGYPSSMKGWRAKHPDLALGVDRAFQLCQGDPEWTAFHQGHWLISHEMEQLDVILDMIADGGARGQTARYAADASCGQWAPYKRALKAAREARAQRMVVVQ